MRRSRDVTGTILAAALAVALLADAPPPAPAPGGSYSGSSEGFANVANPNLGNSCVVTERIDITSFVVTLPARSAKATNRPDPKGKRATPAFVVPVSNSTVQGSIRDTGDRCGPLPEQPRRFSLRYVHSGSYSTADGKLALQFVPPDRSANVIVAFTGSFNEFSQSGVATVSRVDETDPSITWKVAIPITFARARSKK